MVDIIIDSATVKKFDLYLNVHTQIEIVLILSIILLFLLIVHIFIKICTTICKHRKLTSYNSLDSPTQDHLAL